LTLATWSKQKRIGLLAFWAIQRDEACSIGGNNDACSGVNSLLFQVDKAFAVAAKP